MLGKDWAAQLERPRGPAADHIDISAKTLPLSFLKSKMRTLRSLFCRVGDGWRKTTRVKHLAQAWEK